MDAPAAPVAVFKKRGAKAKANIRKRAATPPPADSDSSDYSSSEDEAGQRIKRRRKDKSGNVTTSTKTSAAADADLGATVFKADRSVPITDSNDATKRSNWFDAEDMDSLSTKNLLGTTRSAQQQEPPDGKYKGLANKPSFIQKNPDAPSRTVGPVKAPTNIRTITITDFAPDVCKDVSPVFVSLCH